MCESKVYLDDDLIVEDAIRIEVEGDKIVIYDILGDRKEINGKLKLVDLKEHKIFINSR
ncbi:CooT family nickel-binding protein [Archaeoglobus sp.]